MTGRPSLPDRARATLEERNLAGSDSACLLMVSGGSDSTALAYCMRELNAAGRIGPLAILHVNHMLRGKDADDDQAFVTQLAQLCGIPLFACEVDVAEVARQTGGNIEAAGRQERYTAAAEALESLCTHYAIPLEQGRIMTAHTQDDRVESFYMRSIVGTGPGGFRAMRYRNGPVIRPFLDVSRKDLRAYVEAAARAGASVAHDGEGRLWREDATNAHTDRFRTYVRHEIMPRAKEKNPQLLETLQRTMNLIADEDDMLEDMVEGIVASYVTWFSQLPGQAPDYREGCLIAPEFAREPLPLQRRLCMRVLKQMLGEGERPETSSVERMLAAFAEGRPVSGYTANIQGDLALSANKLGLRIEPMAVYRARRKRKGNGVEANDGNETKRTD